MQATIPHLTRSSLHRCLQRHGISRLPDVEGDKPDKRKFKSYPIGYFHLDIAEVQSAEGRLYLFVAIDRTSKFAFTELHAKATTRVAADFLHALVKAVPYKVHTVLTDNGTHFTDPRGDTWSPAEIRQMIERKEPFRAHAFEYACALAGIDHRLTKPKHPWTTDEVEYPLCAVVLFSARLRATSRRRVGLEVKARPRCLHSRSSFEGSADTRLPRLVQPWVNRLYAASARSPRWRSSRRDRARLYA